MNPSTSAASSRLRAPVYRDAAADVWVLRGLSGDACTLRLGAAEVGALFLADERGRALAALESWLDGIGDFLRALLEVSGTGGIGRGVLDGYARGVLNLLDSLDQELTSGQTTQAGMTLALPVARKLASFPVVLTRVLSGMDSEQQRARDLPPARLTLTPPDSF